MKNLLRTVIVAATLAALAGCTGANGLLAAATTAAGANGTTPNSSTGTTPNTTATSAPTTTTSTPAPKPSTGSSDLQGPGACARTSPAGSPEPGDATTGDYNGQRLPDGWNKQFTSEDQVTNAIDNLYTNDWPCFQKFYPGASTVYKRKRGLS